MFDNQENITLEDAKMVFIPQFFTPSVSDQILANLTQNMDWQQGEITLFGKKILEPRLTAWYGDEGKTYTYSGKKQEPLLWNETLLSIKTDIEKTVRQTYADFLDIKNTPSVSSVHTSIFNSVLCNFYRNGNDSMGFHADNERELGENPLIASVNFGESRRFLLRRKDDKTRKHELILSHGSLLIMGGAMQHHWQHAVPKEPRRMKPRINLTFRHIC